MPSYKAMFSIVVLLMQKNMDFHTSSPWPQFEAMKHQCHILTFGVEFVLLS
jgi:hypothetical protein